MVHLIYHPQNYNKTYYYKVNITCSLNLSEGLPRRVNHPWQLKATELEWKSTVHRYCLSLRLYLNLMANIWGRGRLQSLKLKTREMYYKLMQFHSSFVNQSLGAYVMYQSLWDRATSHMKQSYFTYSGNQVSELARWAQNLYNREFTKEWGLEVWFFSPKITFFCLLVFFLFCFYLMPFTFGYSSYAFYIVVAVLSK